MKNRKTAVAAALMPLCAACILFALALPALAETTLAPFGSTLFQGNFSQAKPETREIGPGDKILLRLWGGCSFDGTLVVGDQGDIDVPGVGMVPLAGLQESQLTDALRSKLNASGQENTQIYCRILNVQPISLVVTGSVMKPGR